jgi:hypothetical protein
LSLHNTYSFFITDQSNLQKDLTSRLGVPQSQDFNVFDLVGKTAELMVLHKQTKAGKTVAKIMAIKPGKKDRDLINPASMISLDKDNFNEEMFLKLPAWLIKKIQSTGEYKKLMGIEEQEVTPQLADDDLPF